MRGREWCIGALLKRRLPTPSDCSHAPQPSTVPHPTRHLHPTCPKSQSTSILRSGLQMAEVYFKVKRTTKFHKIKVVYAEMVGLKVPNLRLHFDGQPIPDGKTPRDVEIEDGDVIENMVPRECYSTCNLLTGRGGWRRLHHSRRRARERWRHSEARAWAYPINMCVEIGSCGASRDALEPRRRGDRYLSLLPSPPRPCLPPRSLKGRRASRGHRGCDRPPSSYRHCIQIYRPIGPAVFSVTIYHGGSVHSPGGRPQRKAHSLLFPLHLPSWRTLSRRLSIA